MSLHLVIGGGNLVETPEMRYTGGGKEVVNCKVAVNNSYRDANGNDVKTTAFYELPFFENMAKRVAAREYQKGDRVEFYGQPNYEMYEYKGEWRFKIIVKFGWIEAVGKGRSYQGDFKAGEGEAEPSTPVTPVEKDAPDDLPF